MGSSAQFQSQSADVGSRDSRNILSGLPFADVPCVAARIVHHPSLRGLVANLLLGPSFGMQLSEHSDCLIDDLFPRAPGDPAVEACPKLIAA